ncbi:hypothetical protein [Pseudescherichia sp.]|nr:hypothetical protein [Pseudescherichia sp.]
MKRRGKPTHCVVCHVGKFSCFDEGRGDSGGETIAIGGVLPAPNMAD